MLAFYRDVFEITLEHSTFAPRAANAPSPRIRSVEEAGSDARVWDVTDTHGSRFRSVFMHAANTPFGLELSEFFDVPRLELPSNPWDIGASTLIFSVRDLDTVTARLRAAATPVVTLGDAPINTPAGRTLLVRDPDGFLIQVVQLLARTCEAGYGFLSIGGRPSERPFGRFVFVHNADGIPVEYVEPATAR